MATNRLDEWRFLLAELAALGEVLRGAITAGDVRGAIAAAMRMRGVRAAIGRVEVTDPDVDGDAVRAATALAGHARVAEAAMQRWLARPLPGDAQLLDSPLGVAVLADALLPEVWDFEVDLVVLVGEALAPVAELLAALGQRRIVLHGAARDGAIAVTSPREAIAAVRTMIPGPPSRMVVRGAADSDPELVRELASELREVLSDLRIHRNTVCSFSKTWIEQGLGNLAALARWPSVQNIGRAFAGVPMVIAAPGPSLARNVHLLRELRGKAIVTAFSHSLRPLCAAGVAPDLVLSVDPQDVRYHFAGSDLSRSCLVNAATVHPALFELPAPRFLTLSANSSIDEWLFEGLGEEAVVPGGGSVATSALSLALRWGCDPIVFVGLDLSFPGGAYYVSTSTDGEARAEIDGDGTMHVAGWSTGFHAMKAGGGPAAVGERTVELPGWHGGTVPSSFMFAMFHRWFVERLRSVTGVTVYNCTEGGARIDGMVHRPLAEVLPGLAGTIDVAAAIDAVTDTSGRRAARLEAHFRKVARALRRCRRLVRRAHDCAAQGIADERLATLERALVKALRPIGFASLLAQHELERALDLARRSDADHLAASHALFRTLANVIDRLEPALAAALARLEPGRPHDRAA